MKRGLPAVREQVARLQGENEALRERAEHYQQESDKYREQCRHWEQRWKDVERCLRVKDRQKATLDSIAHYLSGNWTVAFDHPVLQRALEDAGYDLSEPGEPEPFIHGDNAEGAEG